MTHFQLRDVGGALPWGALLNFVLHLPRTSALSRELLPLTETEKWADGTLVAPILADLVDVVNAAAAVLAAKGTGRSPRRPKPYRRPWATGGETNIGSDAIPIADFEAWWNGCGQDRTIEEEDDG